MPVVHCMSIPTSLSIAMRTCQTLLLTGCLLTVFLWPHTNLHAQQADTQASQQAGLARQDEQMRQAGWQIMYLVDFGQMGDIWDHASSTMKNLVLRDEFVRQITTHRIKLGAFII